jgi:hypothetical protein
MNLSHYSPSSYIPFAFCDFCALCGLPSHRSSHKQVLLVTWNHYSTPASSITYAGTCGAVDVSNSWPTPHRNSHDHPFGPT